ncbi:hypothetical protein J4410_07495 [Candidatus Woesearchaeota archaeon]|nr:hypothetical protein [Candidatus Woesearchaeota archaeon]
MIRHKRPDQKNALSILEAAESEMKFTLTIKPSEQAGSTIIRNIYECYRMVGDALLVSKGIESDDHVTPIKEITQLKVQTTRPLQVIDNLRRLRHNINYYGYKPKIEEVKDTISIAKATFEPILKEIKKEVTQKITLEKDKNEEK